MSACEKCWAEAGGDANAYADLARSRNHRPCSPEQQAGPAAAECHFCKRRTLHQHTGQPMCGCPEFEQWREKTAAAIAFELPMQCPKCGPSCQCEIAWND